MPHFRSRTATRPVPASLHLRMSSSGLRSGTVLTMVRCNAHHQCSPPRCPGRGAAQPVLLRGRGCRRAVDWLRMAAVINGSPFSAKSDTFGWLAPWLPSFKSRMAPTRRSLAVDSRHHPIGNASGCNSFGETMFSGTFLRTLELPPPFASRHSALSAGWSFASCGTSLPRLQRGTR
jgi:hypothetical protein